MIDGKLDGGVGGCVPTASFPGSVAAHHPQLPFPPAVSRANGESGSVQRRWRRR
jgi:hypothetical protein